jgi:transposase InsO family protein
VRFRFIEAEKANYPVTILCRLLRVRRSGFYAWQSRGESERSRTDRRLAVMVKSTFEASYRHSYGSPRVYRDLRAAGHVVGRHRVARLMREQGLQARKRRRFVKTTDSQHSHPVPANLLKRNFEAAAPNQVWVGDVTFISTHEGWLYLAVLIDLFSRRVVGWAMSDKNDEPLTLAALQMAIDHRAPRPGLIHHTDRGTTYAATSYQDVLAKHGFLCSMSRKGNCLDNAVAESLFSTLKTECTARVTFPSRDAARAEVFAYIATFYNPIRRHSHIGYRSPMEFERVAGQ